MCGHGIIGLTQGPGRDRDGRRGREPDDHPHRHAGGTRRGARRHTTGGVVRAVTFENVPSFVYRRGIEVRLAGIGETVCDIAFGGAYYAFCDAADLGLSLEPSQHDRLIEVGRLVKARRAGADVDRRPGGARPRVPLRRDLHRPACRPGPPQPARVHLRRGRGRPLPDGDGRERAGPPCSTTPGELPDGETIVIESILGTCFGVAVVGRSRVATFPAVVPEVSGEAYFTGTSSFFVEPGDPLARWLHLPLTAERQERSLTGRTTRYASIHSVYNMPHCSRHGPSVREGGLIECRTTSGTSAIRTQWMDAHCQVPADDHHVRRRRRHPGQGEPPGAARAAGGDRPAGAGGLRGRRVDRAHPRPRPGQLHQLHRRP